MTDDADLPFHLKGNYAPVMEERTETRLEVTGAIPPELDGLYVRNGSNPKNGQSSHWFFGDGMLHGVKLEGGRAVWYRNRWVRTTKFLQDADAVDPATMLDRTASAANTHVLGHAGRILALEEGHFPYLIGPELETLGCESYGDRLQSAFTAHPKLCPETNELHAFGYSPIEPYLTYLVLDAKGDLVHSVPIDVPGPTMMHDFIMTRDHVVFMDLPVVFDLKKALEGGIPLYWDERYGARIGVLRRFGRSEDVQWFDVDPCYVFHAANAWVDGNQVVCDVGRHAYMWRDSMEDFAPAILTRWRLDLESGRAREEALDEESHGFPRVDDRVVGLPYRYTWATCASPGSDSKGIDAAGAVRRYDMRDGSSLLHDFGPEGVPGEFVFVPARQGAGEDEGWAMGFVYDRSRDESELVLLDASRPQAAPVARVQLPVRVPHGFHGSWIARSGRPGSPD